MKNQNSHQKNSTSRRKLTSGVMGKVTMNAKLKVKSKRKLKAGTYQVTIPKSKLIGAVKTILDMAYPKMYTYNPVLLSESPRGVRTYAWKKQPTSEKARDDQRLLGLLKQACAVS